MSILVAGVGNIFFGDDGFGVEVATRRAQDPVPAGVRLEEYGIRGLHLAYELLEGHDTLVLVDALPLGEAPGTVAVVEVDPDDVGVVAEDGQPLLDAHSMSPAVVLSQLRRLGGHLDRVIVIGCQPASIEEGIGLSPEVEAAVPLALRMIDEVLDELCAVTITAPPPREGRSERWQWSAR